MGGFFDSKHPRSTKVSEGRCGASHSRVREGAAYSGM